MSVSEVFDPLQPARILAPTYWPYAHVAHRLQSEIVGLHEAGMGCKAIRKELREKATRNNK